MIYSILMFIGLLATFVMILGINMSDNEISVTECVNKESLITNDGYLFFLDLNTSIGKLENVQANIYTSEGPLPVLYYKNKRLNLNSDSTMFLASVLDQDIEYLKICVQEENERLALWSQST